MSASVFGACALLDTNQVKCWGDNEDGRLGLGDREHRGDDPAEMGDYLPSLNMGTGRSVIGLSYGSFTGTPCAILDDRLVKCWGAAGQGELGNESTFNHGDTAAIEHQLGDSLPPVDLGTEM